MNRRVIIPCGIALLLLALLLGAIFVTSPRSDEFFAKRFQIHKGKLEELVTLLKTNQINFVQRHSEDRDVLLETRGNAPSAEVSSHSTYGANLRRLFDTIGCEYASWAADEITVCLPRNGIEDLYPGGHKAFVFRATQPATLVESLDEHRRNNRGQYDFYRSLEGGWYIKYKEAH